MEGEGKYFVCDILRLANDRIIVQRDRAAYFGHNVPVYVKSTFKILKRKKKKKEKKETGGRHSVSVPNVADYVWRCQLHDINSTMRRA